LASVRKEKVRIHFIIPIEKKLIFFVIFGIFFISIIFAQPAFAIESHCEWELQETTSVQVGQISYGDNEKTFANIENQLPQALELNCLLSEPTSLQNKLIDFEFLIKSAQNYDMSMSVFDTAGNRIFNSAPIMKLYDVSQNQRAHVVLDPIDFGIERSSISNKAQGLDKKIDNLKLTLSSNDYESITISNSRVTNIDEFPDFDLEDNLPVQSTIPGFLGLLLVSFPMGFVLLDKTRFMQKENFVHKIPWFLGFGFTIFIGFAYIISHFWISFEVVVAYVAFSLSVMALYIIKNKSLLISFRNTKSKKSIIFFSAILVISAIVAINYQESIGWQTGTTDGIRHVSMISLTAANHVIDDRGSFLPISDIPAVDPHARPYPKAAHAAAAGLSFLTETIPSVSMEAIFGYTIFLIPPMFTSIVYRFSRSIFLSSVMFMITFWISSLVFFGDIMLYKISAGNFPSHVGILVMLTSFMIFIEYFEKGKKLSLFLYFVITIFVIGVTYYGIVLLPILIGIVGFLIYHINNTKKRAIVLGALVVFFVSMPLWTYQLHDMVLGLNQSIPFAYHWLEEHYPFDPSKEIFLFWVSSIIGLIAASFLIISEKYRALSIIVIFVSVIHLLVTSYEQAVNYTYYYQSLRTIGLMFLLSVAMILIMIHVIPKLISLKPTGYLSKIVKNNLTKVAILSLIFVALLPGLQIYVERDQVWQKDSVFKIGGIYETFPGGNERNLQFWLYENTEPNDLILNDLSLASSWFIGFRAQNLMNGERQNEEIRFSYNIENDEFKPKYQGTIDSLKAHKILKHP